MILQYVQIFVNFYILLMSAPLRRFPRVHSERIFIGSICLLSLNIVSLFQSSLATVFIKPMYYKNIDSLKTFADTRQEILIKYPAMLTDLFPEDSSDTFRTLHDRMVLIPKGELTAYNVTYGMGMATVTRKITLGLLNDKHLVHMISECPRSYNLAYLLVKHSVYSEKVNSLILNINQFGLINRWINDIYFTNHLQSIKNFPPINIRPRVLLLNDLLFPFMILMAGVSITVCVFAIEVIVYFYSKRKEGLVDDFEFVI